MHWHPTEVKCLSASMCEDPGVQAFSLHCSNPRRMSSRESREHMSARTTLISLSSQTWSQRPHLSSVLENYY